MDGVSFTNLFVSATGTACTWTASADVLWLTNHFPASGTGTAPVVFSVLPNAGPSRTGEVTAAGIVHTVIQSGCEFSLNTNLTTVAVDGVSFTNLFVSATGTACTWTASANVPWLTNLFTASGTGSTPVAFSILPNAGETRTGVVMAADIEHLVIQIGCELTMSPTNSSFTATGGLGGFSVNPNGTACVWTITAPADWITIDSPTNGAGLTVVSYSVQTNTTTLPRTATITVAGVSHVVEQAAAELPPFVQWQLDNFKCTNCPEAATTADPDGDGQDNWAEFLAGFAPTNSASFFQITGLNAEGPDLRVNWLAGGGRTNVVQSTEKLTTNFTDISSLYIIPPGVPVLTNHLHLGGATNHPSHFYRIRLVP
ncbi:MAG: hypothetical protein PCFJNLEI_03791 [Verrucomicrobiae bacterium]|nr:hypothetical protein [Verrucomicrobiae bacterium]